MKRLFAIFGIVFGILGVGLGVKQMGQELPQKIAVFPIEVHPEEPVVHIEAPQVVEIPPEVIVEAAPLPIEAPVAAVELAPAPEALKKEEVPPAAIVEAAPLPIEAPVAAVEPVPTPIGAAEAVKEEPKALETAALVQNSAPETNSDSSQPQDTFCQPCKPPIKKVVKSCPPKACKPCATPSACCWKFDPCNPKRCTNMNCGGLFVAADFLYWASQNHGFSYAYEVQSETTRGIGKVVRLDTAWDPGFRVGLGWNTGYNFWDLLLNYTWYQNHVSQTKSSELGFMNIWPVSNAILAEFSDVSASYRLQMNMGDIELGRLIYLTRTVALRPHVGVKGGSLNQKLNDHFTGQLGGTSNEELKFVGKNDFWGVGPSLGLDGEWHLSSGFSILGKLAGALLYGETDIKSETSIRPASSEFVVFRQYTDRFTQLAPNLQLALGFQWQTCFWCEQMFYKASLSWEANCWWDQFNLPIGTNVFPAYPTVGSQPLTTQGLTYKMEWDF